MNYGMPYMGSKNKIAEWVISHLPSAENFYDVCCGGGAITHCAMVNNKYTNYYINDIDSQVVYALHDAFNGKFKDENRWISRGDFFKLKDTDFYVSSCFSFGNNKEKGYAYSKELEPLKKAVHYAILFGDYSLFEEYYHIKCIDLTNVTDRRDRRLLLNEYLKLNLENINSDAKKYIASSVNNSILLDNENRLERLQRLESLERLENLESLGRLENLENLQSIFPTSLSFEELDIKPNSVIYCDVPYRNTAKYKSGGFDYDKFYDWACNQEHPVFISEYWMPEDRFECIAEKQKRSVLSATNNSKISIEKLFIPKGQKHIKQTLF